MHLSTTWYPLEQELTARFPRLRPAQQRGLCAWTVGTLLAESACEAAVVLALHESATDLLSDVAVAQADSWAAFSWPAEARPSRACR